jgi:hypothetical protein
VLQRSRAQGSTNPKQRQEKPSRHNRQARRREIEKADFREVLFFIDFLHAVGRLVRRCYGGCQTLFHDFFVIFRQLAREKSAAYRFVEIDIFGAGFDLRYATTRAWEVRNREDTLARSPR